MSNGHCSTCDVEATCGYPYKPCDCCNYRKFRPLKPEEAARQRPRAPVYDFVAIKKERENT